ncbi:SEC-C domain-containing protein [Symbioplanes lichenis]|uniref:SEC-C domain-containing protein n=1 Tax=Symbioplanes lichenis TaxID=1629072 RepID=UPI0027392A8D|nr:SEC-C domain-containing protein [Actinoplanes lichenis]
MLTSTDLTNDGLRELRQTALGRPDPLGLAAELAEAAEAGRLAEPDDSGTALVLAAEIAEARHKFDAALRYADRAVAFYGTRDDGPAVTAKAAHARMLFQAGRPDDALAELEPLRPALTKHSDAAAYISAALSIGGRNRIALDWLTEAVEEALAERKASGGTAEPSSADDAGLLFFLLQQRHRVRHALNLPHDTHDNLADRLETRLANAATATQADSLLFFPQAEFDKVVAQWPALSESYGKDWEEHRARLERELVRLTGTGRTGLTVLSGTADGLTRAAADGDDPADPKSRAAYARQLSGGTSQIPWPPERNGACWCGSGNKYKKCCLPRSRS